MDNIGTCPMGPEEGAALKELLDEPKHDSKTPAFHELPHHKRPTLEGDRSQGSHQGSTVEKAGFFPVNPRKIETTTGGTCFKKLDISALHALFLWHVFPNP